MDSTHSDQRLGAVTTQVGRLVARTLLAGSLALVASIAAAPVGYAQSATTLVRAESSRLNPYAARPSRLDVNAQVVMGTVTLTGRLASPDGSGIPGVLEVAVDGRPLGSVSCMTDGTYGVAIPGVSPGRHTAVVTYAGSGTAGPASARQVFQVAPDAAPATTRPVVAQPPAAPPVATGAAVLSAKVTPTTATPGGYIDVSGTLVSAANAPISQARIEVSTSWGGGTGAGATNAAGAFSVSISLPTLPEGQTPPAGMTVTVTYPGDGPYPPTNQTLRVALKAAGPTPPPPSIRTETPAPPVEKDSGTRPTTPPRPGFTLDFGDATNRGVAVLVFVLAVGAVSTLAGMGAVAWRRNQLMPGERRGFGTDFGKGDSV